MKILSVVCCIILCNVATLSFGQIDPINRTGIAIDGYDVVSYFNAGNAVKGQKEIHSEYNTVTYYFQSRENQLLFEASPTRYIPQYDGYCALAVSYGKKISIDPTTFKIINGKLYLFFNGKTRTGHFNSLHTWNRNEKRLLEKADQNWPDVKKKSYQSEETF